MALLRSDLASLWVAKPEALARDEQRQLESGPLLLDEGSSLGASVWPVADGRDDAHYVAVPVAQLEGP